jgi:AraC family transcriptional regulator
LALARTLLGSHRNIRLEAEVSSMIASLPTEFPSLKAGAYGMDFAARFHLSDSSSLTTPWPDEQAFAVTRLCAASGMLDRTLQFDREQALVVSVSLNTIPLGNYRFWTEGKFREVPFLAPFTTSVTDMESDPVCWVTGPFDYMHYHVPRTGLDDIAKSVGIQPVGTFRCVLAENDPFLSQFTKLVLPMLESGSQLPALLLDHFSLLLGAHLLQRYAGIPKLPEMIRGGLAPWQKRKAAEFLSDNLANNVRLRQVAKECELSVSHFARAFKETFGVSAYRWLIQKRLSHAQHLLLNTTIPLIEIALQSGFPDQASFTRVFKRNLGVSPGCWRKHHRD